MNKLLLLTLLSLQLGFITKIYSQNIAINATGNLPDTSAMLDLSSTNKGFLAPRLTTAQQNAIPLPATGLLVFNTTTNTFNVNTGTTGSPVWTALSFAGTGLSSMNGLTTGTQTFATGTTGTNFNIASSGSAHTFNIPDASATARGVVTTGTQIFAGNKTFNGTITAGSLSGGADTDSLVTTDATGLLKKRTIASVVAGNVWGTAGNNPVNSGNQFFGSVNNASLRFRTFNVERMVIDSVGNFGVGTATPLKPIDIVRSLPAQGGLMQFRNTAANGYTSIDLQNELGTQVGNIGWGNTSASAPYANSFYFSTNVASPMFFMTSNTERLRILATGEVGIGTLTPTAILHLKAGTAAANSAPLKFTTGVNTTAVENGAVEYDGTNYFASAASTRYTLAKTLTATSSLDFASTNAANSRDLTIGVPGAQLGDVVALGVPSTSVVANSDYTAYVSSANTVTVRLNNYSVLAINPAAGTFRVSVIRY